MNLVYQEISDNFREFKKLFSHPHAARLYERPGLLLIDSGTPFSSWNSIITCAQPGDSIERLTEEINRFYSQTKTPLCWWTCPGTDSTEILKNPFFSSFQLTEVTAAMAMDLETYLPQDEKLPALKITTVSSPEEIDSFISVLRRSYELPLFTRDALLAVITQNIFNSPASLILYIANRGSVAVGCAALFLTDDVAGLYYVGTLPSHRAMGIGTALTVHCLNNARNLQCRQAVLRASESGERMYTRLGFKKFGEFKKFIWNRHPYKNMVWKAKYLLGIALDKAMEDAIWFS